MVMFDVTHPVIAGINHLLSKSYLAAGEFEKVRTLTGIINLLAVVLTYYGR